MTAEAPSTTRAQGPALPSGVHGTNDRCGAARSVRFLTGKNGDVVSLGGERAGERAAEKSGAAGDDDVHVSSIGRGDVEA